MSSVALNAADCEITSVSITSSRGGTRDITKVVHEYEVFEDITKPYCTGTLTFVDHTGWTNGFKFMGTERVTIKVTPNEKGTATPEGTAFTKSWIAHSIQADIKDGNTDGRGAVFAINLVEEHAMASEATKFSIAIGNGTKLEDEIKVIMQIRLGLPIDKDMTTESIQSNWKAIIPYMHPLEAVEWLRDRASTGNGIPYLVYPTIYSDSYRMATLDNLLKQAPFNGTGFQNAYKYGGAHVQDTEKKPFLERQRSLTTINYNKSMKSFEQIMSGTCGASYSMLELDKNEVQGFVPKHYDITKDILGKIPTDSKQNVYDESFSLKGVGTPHANDARIITQTLNRKTYRPGQNYKSIHWESDADTHIHKIRTRAALQMMMRNTMEVTVTGLEVLAKKKGVGDRINLHVEEDKVGDPQAGVPEGRKSGNFLILTTRHVFKKVIDGNRHLVQMTVTKFNEGPSS